MQECVGREREKEIFNTALNSNAAEMIAVTGRRRVGKTFLIRSYFQTITDFEITGIHEGTLKEQLDNFSYQLTEYSNSPLPLARPKNWIAAFRQLSTFLENKKTKRKKVIFIDELPWIATNRSGFMKALEYFWNTWAVKKDIVVILCGSAATWMLRRIVHNKGGLHNRITRQIRLLPFNLHETKLYLETRNIRLDNYQIAQLYMVTGGVPHYLKEVLPGESTVQNIDRICFESQGLLRDEFTKLYASLFDNPEHHIAIVRTLAQNRMGLTRKQIVEKGNLKDGGSISRILEELEGSGFIMTTQPFAKRKKETLIRLSDEYSLFYLKFIERKRAGGKGTWQQLAQSQSWKIWSGYAFENLCLKHISNIKKALGISAIYTEAASFYFAGNEDISGFQIDLLIDRKDHIINVCELKFHSASIVMTKTMANALREKLARFQSLSKTQKQVSLIMVTAFGLKQNEHSLGLVEKSISLPAFFKPV